LFLRPRMGLKSIKLEGIRRHPLIMTGRLYFDQETDTCIQLSAVSDTSSKFQRAVMYILISGEAAESRLAC